MILIVDFGPDKSGLATVGYKTVNAAGSDVDARSTSGVVDLGGGQYQVSVTPGDGAVSIIWDTGETIPIYATEAFDLLSNVTTIRKLQEADRILEDVGGVQKLKTYEKGTDTELITAKTAKQPGGAALTNPATQRLAGYQE